MDKKQMRFAMILPVMGLAALCATRCAHAKDVSEVDAAVQAVLAAKATWVVAYATPQGKKINATRYDIARLLCYAPDNEAEILADAFKVQEAAEKMSLSTAIAIAVVSTCNKQLFGRAT